MLTSLNSLSEQVEASQVEKHQGPFRCPECGGPTTLKKGAKVIHHFAHTPPYDCSFGAGETPVHRAAKKALQNLFLSHKNIEFAGQEKALPNGARPDVLVAGKNGSLVAIEVQAAAQTPSEVDRRTARINAAGVAVMWVIVFKADNLNRALYGKLHYDSDTGRFSTEKYLKIRDGERRIASLYCKRPFAWHPEEKALYSPNSKTSTAGLRASRPERTVVAATTRDLRHSTTSKQKKITTLSCPGMRGTHADAWKNVPKRYILTAKDWEAPTGASLQPDVINRKLSKPAWIRSDSDRLVCKFWPGEGDLLHRHIITTWKKLPTGELTPQHSTPHGTQQCTEIWQTMFRNGWREFTPS